MRHSEQRRSTRIPSSHPVVMLINGESVYGTMTDFSKHGLGFMSSVSAHVNDTVELHFNLEHLDHHEEAFILNAEVKHCWAIRDVNHIGVRLDADEDYTKLYKEHTTSAA